MIRICTQFFGGRGSKSGGGNRQSSSQQALQKLQSMTDEEFEQTVRDLYNSDTDRYDKGLNNSYYLRNGTQALIKEMGINDKPQVVEKGSVDEMAKANGTPILYRGLSNSKSMSSEEIAKQMLNDPDNRIGGGVFGDGFYFSPKLSVAEHYSGYGGTVVKATLNPKTAKVIDIDTLNNYQEKLSQHPTKHSLTDMLWYAGDSPQWGNSGESILALKMGYNVIKLHNGNHVVIDRGALIVEEV